MPVSGDGLHACSRRSRRGWSFLQHYFRRFNNCGNCIADFECHFFRASSGDDAFNQIIAHLNNNVGHYVPELELDDCADKTVAG